MLVITPGRLERLLGDGTVSLRAATDVVLDEVDGLALADGGAALAPLRDLEARFVFVTATLPRTLEKTLRAEFPGLEVLKGPGLHRAPPGLDVRLVDCTPDASGESLDPTFSRKARALLTALGAGAGARSGLLQHDRAAAAAEAPAADRRGRARRVSVPPGAGARQAGRRDTRGASRTRPSCWCTDRARGRGLWGRSRGRRRPLRPGRANARAARRPRARGGHAARVVPAAGATSPLARASSPTRGAVPLCLRGRRLTLGERRPRVTRVPAVCSRAKNRNTIMGRSAVWRCRGILAMWPTVASRCRVFYPSPGRPRTLHQPLQMRAPF